MNAKLYRLVFNTKLGMYVPAHEAARSHGKARGSGIQAMALLAALLAACPAIAAKLPVPCGGGPCGANPNPTAFVTAGAAGYAVNGTRGIVTQTTSKAILNWQSFNLGRGNTLEFIQPSTDAATLNRVWQADPSVIAGSIKANGQIYLINQNGILFANGAQINVGGMVASALDMDDAVFLHPSGLFSLTDDADNVSPAFRWRGTAEGFADSLVRVAPDARLEAALGGAIMLFAPKVINRGEIHAQEGQVVLAAGGKVYLAPPPDPDGLKTDSPFKGLAGMLVEVDPFEGKDALNNDVKLSGQAINDNLGRIISERGNATLAALAVNQMGRVTATTSVTHKGSIRLLARERMVYDQQFANQGEKVISAQDTGAALLGKDSVTEVLPELSSGKTITQGQGFNPSTVEVMGGRIVLDEGAGIVVPGGHVSLSAQADGTLFIGGDGSDNGHRIYMAQGTRIDVSGVEDVDIEMARNFIEVELRGNELRDNPLNRDGYIRGKKVWMDIRDLPDRALADVSGYVNQVGRGIGEKLSAGGTAALRSEGDIVQRQGAVVDISGGSLAYRSGYGHATQLVSEGRVFNIGDAPADRIYDGIIGQYSFTDPRWGVTRTIALPLTVQFFEGYVHGQNAGTLSLQAHALVMDGDLVARTVVGPYQRQRPNTNGTPPALAQLPAPGSLVIGDASQAGASGGDMKTPDVLLTRSHAALSGSFDAHSALTPEQWSGFVLSTTMLRRGGVGHVALYGNGRITVAKDGGMRLPAYGSLTLVGDKVVMEGDIRAMGGNITLASQQTVATTDIADTGVWVGEDVSLSVAGNWTNDALPASDVTTAVVLDGGDIEIKSFTGLHLARGSVLDADGGAWINSARKLQGGKGGDIALSAGADAPILDGSLRARGMSGGGKLTLKVPALTIGAIGRGVEGELLLAPEYFAGNGFGSYVLEGVNSVVVSDGTHIRPHQARMVLDVGFATQASGTALTNFSHLELLPDGQRQAVDLTLRATRSEAYLPDGSRAGWLTVGEGAAIELEAGGVMDISATQHQLAVHGRLAAPAGEIRLTMHGDPGQANDVGHDPAQAIWISHGAELAAHGTVTREPGDDGLAHGQVLEGGRISLVAKKGYLVAQSGALLDVSGASASLDIATPSGQGVTYQRQRVASSGGSIVVQAREGLVMDATMDGSAPGSVGGSLTLTLDRAEILGADKSPAYPGTSSAFGSNDPDRRWKIVVGTDYFGIADGLVAGNTIDATAPGRARIGARHIEAAGFASLRLNAEHAVAFEGNVDLTLSRDLVINAPVLESDGGSVRLGAAYVDLANNTIHAQRQKLAAVLPGVGHLNVSGQHIDLTGHLALQGFGQTALTSAGDIRAVGVIPAGGTPYPAGTLGATGSVAFTARQIYPSTLTDYLIDVQGPGARLEFKGHGAPTPVLSAAGRLVARADEILQGGAVKAPFGEIVLQGAASVSLEPGSLTSVSAEDQVIPLGSTVLTGRKWVYSVNGLSRELVAPDKAISLSAPAVKLAEGASVDVSGGGDLLAQEWIPGLGGSRDVLDASNSPNTYAILPGHTSTFAPQDHQYEHGSSQPLEGQSVYLSGMDGLPAGHYTLLPARYALLPGAYAVTVLAGQQDMTPSQNHVRADGAAVVSGQSALLLADGSLMEVGRRGAYLLEPASLVRGHSEYLATSVSKFFMGTDSPLPGDAGRVSIEASNSLVLRGTLAAGHDEGLRGGQVDLSAPRLAVISDGKTVVPGYLTLEVGMLNALKAESLLLGGTRIQTREGAWTRVGAEEVLLANDARQALKGPEVLLAARQGVTLASGAAIRGTGKGTPGERRLTLGYGAHADLDLNRDGLLDDADGMALGKDLNADGVANLDDVAIQVLELAGGQKFRNPDNTARNANRNDLAPVYAIGDLNGDRRVDLADLHSVDGDGALLAVANTVGLEVARQAVVSGGGILRVALDATVSGKAVILDATLDNLAAARPDITSGGQLAIGAGRISFGATPAGVPGLGFDAITLKALLGGVSDLSLRSYSTLDIHGDLDMHAMYADLRGNNPALSLPRLILQTAGIAGYGGDAVLEAGVLELSNLSGTAFSAPVLAGGAALTPDAGGLTLLADELRLGDGAFRVAGYVQATVVARRDLATTGQGSLSADGDLTLSAPRIIATDGARFSFDAGGLMKTTRRGLPSGYVPPAAGIVASLSFSGERIEHGGRVEVPVGEVAFVARAGDLKLVNGGQILAGGRTARIHDETIAMPGGRVRLESVAGNVIMDTDSLLDVSAAGADAGRVEVLARQGYFRAGGELSGASAPLMDAKGLVASVAGEGAVFHLDAGSLFDAGAVGGSDDFSAVNTALGNGFSGKRVFRVRSGDIQVAATDTVKASLVELSADHGGILVAGTLDASGDKGGEIGLYASGDLTLEGGGKLLAQGLADTESAAGTRGRGGTVILSTAGGNLSTQADAVIDVSGDQAGAVRGTGGRVWLRAGRTGAGNDLAITRLDGQILGAREILAEAVKVYSGYARIDMGNSIIDDKLGFDSLDSDNNAFMGNNNANAQVIATRLGQDANPAFRVMPGVEVSNAGNLEVTRDWNLFKSNTAALIISRPTATRLNQPMVLTLRAEGDLDIKGSINDGFWIGNTLGERFDQSKHNAYALQPGASSSYNFVAGADTSAANPHAYLEGGGDFVLAAGKFLRTGEGEIRIVSGGDVILGGDKSVIYTAGVPGPAVPGFDRLSPAGFPTAFPNQNLKAIYPTQGGNIHIRAAGNVEDRNSLAEETHGWLLRYWDTEVDPATGVAYLNQQPSYFPRFDLFRRGIGTLGGGDIDVEAGGSANNLWLYAPTNARLGGNRSLSPDAANLVVQGGGDVRLRAAMDILGAHVVVQQGQGRLIAGQDVEAGFTMGQGNLSVLATRQVTVKGFVDPFMQNYHGNNKPAGVDAGFVDFLLNSSDPASRLDLLAVLEGIALESDAYAYPGTLTARTPLGDVVVRESIHMLPHPTGQLVLAAGGSVVLEGNMVMSDYSPSGLPDMIRPGATVPEFASYESFLNHAPEVLHLGDHVPARIFALGGDVRGTTDSGALTELVLPKAAMVKAGLDVRDLSMVIQNVHADDVSEISAGRDIRLPDGFNVTDGTVNTSNHTIRVAGPGYLVLKAGHDVDLGSSGGVLSIGNEFNPYLDKQGADLMILAGLGTKDGALRQPDVRAFAAEHLVTGSKALKDLYSEFGYRARKDMAVSVLADHPELDPDNGEDKARIEAYLDGAYAGRVKARQDALWLAFEAMPLEVRVSRVFFNELQQAGNDFNEALPPKSDKDAKRGYDAVALLFPDRDAEGPVAYAGDVNFYFSQVRSNRGGDVEIFAPGGLVNVGLASGGKLSRSEADLGLFTIRGGDIRAYVHDDFLVNQSRVFTLGGGDILLWSDEGDIDAGKGAKTAAAAPPPQLRVENGRIFFDITSSVSGSGIGTISTSRANPRDDGYLIAPNGEINAGDAGIQSAGNLSIAAVRVVGADNIQVGGISTGVPVADASGLSSGLSGVSGLNESTGATSEATRSLASSAKEDEENAQATRQLLAGFKPTFISVEVLGFGEGTASLGGPMDEAELKRREKERRGSGSGA